jgi:pimeloyl-ACP methyl ester carboxylesterase
LTSVGLVPSRKTDGYCHATDNERVAATGGNSMEIESRGFRLHYLKVGSGPAIVLIPGFLMSVDRWTDTGYVDRLAKTHTVVAVDPLGFGRSERVTDPAAYEAALLASDVVRALDTEGIDRAVMWGYSRGAGLAADVAALHPDRVSGLIAGGTPVHIPRSALASATIEDMAPLIAGDWDFLWERFPVPLTDDIKRLFEQTNDPAAAAAAYVGTVGDLDTAALQCPMFFYVGGGEWFADVVAEGADELGAGFARLGDLGHGETHQSTDLVCDTIDPFLASLDA